MIRTSGGQLKSGSQRISAEAQFPTPALSGKFLSHWLAEFSYTMRLRVLATSENVGVFVSEGSE